jgi:hypothetical protein
MRTFAAPLLLLLALSLPVAAQVTQVDYASLTGAESVGFDDIAGGPAPGTRYDGLFVSNGVAFGERFSGQTMADAGGFDRLEGTPVGGLSLLAGAAGRNLNVFVNGSSQVLTGLGSAGYPQFDAIGEGAFAMIFSSDQSEFGFQLVGGDGGSATIDFFARDGSLIDSVLVGSLANSFYGFSRDGGVNDIAGISIWNTDAAGIGFDNLKHDVASNVPPPSAIPEPSAGAFMLAGLGALGWSARRRARAGVR